MGSTAIAAERALCQRCRRGLSARHRPINRRGGKRKRKCDAQERKRTAFATCELSGSAGALAGSTQIYIFIKLPRVDVYVCSGPSDPIEPCTPGAASAAAARGVGGDTAVNSRSRPLGSGNVYFQQGHLIRASSCQRFVSALLLSPKLPLLSGESGASGKWTHLSQRARRQTIAWVPCHHLP